MASDDARRLTAAAGRKFAWTLAAAFALLALFGWWREREALIRVASAIAILLGVAGVVVPAKLGPLERAWMKLGELLSRVTAPVFLAVVYFLVLTPLALVRRAMGRSAIHRDRSAGTFWFAREIPPDAATARRRMERQF